MDIFVILRNNYLIPWAFILLNFMTDKLYMKKIFALFVVGMLFANFTEANSTNNLNFMTIIQCYLLIQYYLTILK